MPISKIEKAEQFVSLQTEARASGDNNHCAVIAIAATTGAPFAKVQGILARLGRVKGKGTYSHQMEECCNELGYEMVRVSTDTIRDNYPPRFRAPTASPYITTHHPDRFPAAWKNGNNYMAMTANWGHVAAIVDGVNVDWTRGKARRINTLFQIVKI